MVQQPGCTSCGQGRRRQGKTGAGEYLSSVMVSGIGEYRIDWGPGHRICLIQDGEDLIILLGGGTKKRQQKDIDEAKTLYKEYKARKKAG